ncbi:hypothetical protein BKA93DRAFT_829861 [Sparassis latifolia]
MKKTGLCLALFVLIEPVESGQHTSSTTEKFTNELIEDMASEDIDVFTSQLRETMQDLAEAAGRRLEEDRSVSICHPVLSEGRQREDCIKFNIAEEEGDDDGYSHSFRRDLLDLDSEKPGVSTAHLRKIWRIEPLPSDDVSLEQVTAPMDSDDDKEDETGGSFGRRGRSQRDDECTVC